MLLGRIAAFYGFSVPEGENQTSLADSVRARLARAPKLGDRIRFDDIELVVRAIHGERITSIGLDLERRCARHFMSARGQVTAPIHGRLITIKRLPPPRTASSSKDVPLDGRE